MLERTTLLTLSFAAWKMKSGEDLSAGLIWNWKKIKLYLNSFVQNSKVFSVYIR